jgi:hypothetical protein
MKRSIIIFLLLCLLYPAAEAQLWKMRRYELGVGIGPSMYFGDIGGFSKKSNILGLKDLSFLQTRYALSFNFKYRITREINARFSLTQGLLHATDERGSNEVRGYEASSSFIEPVVLGEYYFIKNSNENSYIFAKRGRNIFAGFISALDVYAFTGFGGLSYSIKPNDLLNLKMIEKGYPTSGFTGIIPLGVGTSVAFSPVFNLGLELSGRYSFSDNLDGYTSQFSSSNDVYYFMSFTLTYKMRTTPNGYPTFR